MPCKYLDPYKDDPYGKLKGDKADQYFKTTFDEAIIHKTDNAYIFAANVIEYQGLVRSFKAEQALTPGLCVIPIYGKEYSIGKKGADGKWSDETFQPSLFEKAFYDTIAANESIWIVDGKGLSGYITHLPDEMVVNIPSEQRGAIVTQNTSLALCDLSGKLPKYTLPFSKSFGKGGGKSWGLSPDQRIDFLVKQMLNDVAIKPSTEDATLASLMRQMIAENQGDEAFISIYFDVLIASIR